ncbi:MAG: hypothetical protein ABIP20_13115 [Chthoniobacteraceae bacterium]
MDAAQGLEIPARHRWRLAPRFRLTVVRYFVNANVWIFCLRRRSRPASERRLREAPENIVLALRTHAELRLSVAKCTQTESEPAEIPSAPDLAK